MDKIKESKSTNILIDAIIEGVRRKKGEGIIAFSFYILFRINLKRRVMNIMAIIDSIKDKLGTIIYPKSVTQAIYDKDTNERLDDTLLDIKQDVIIGATGSFTYVKTVDFIGETITTGTINVNNGIITSIS